ncbi:MAG: molecular chaperone HtpG, partial [Bacteroidales bacterium]|nr:molecular chaperone HtpG [Bacteroidales bacterium]
ANKEQLAPIYSDIEASEARKNELNKAKEGKKDEEIPQADKDALADVEKKLNELSTKRVSIISQFAHTQKQISQLIDLALLQNGMLSGEKLAQFVKRSIDLMK